MTLPREISPNPLLTSTVEIRFDSGLSEEDVLGVFYPIFSRKFPKIKDKAIPKEIKRQSNIQYATDYVLSGDHYSISLGKNTFAFENVGTYHLWSNYFPVIKENLEVLKGMNVVKKVIRVGIRYASLFEGITEMGKILKYPLGFEHIGYTQTIKSHQSTFTMGDISLFLQIFPEAKSTPNDKGAGKKGFYIDIDASQAIKGDLQIGDVLFDLIDRLHYEEKKLFFSLLNEGFISTLNPKY